MFFYYKETITFPFISTSGPGTKIWVQISLTFVTKDNQIILLGIEWSNPKYPYQAIRRADRRQMSNAASPVNTIMITESSVEETPYDWIPLDWKDLATKENALIVAAGKRGIMT